MFNLYIRHLSVQVLHCDLFQYADDSSLIKVTPLKDDRTIAADEINADLDRIYSWGQMWNINFERVKCHTLCVSLKQDVDLHPPLFMTILLVDEVNVLKILGICFNCKLTCSYMIDQLATRCHQLLGALYHVREYFGQSGLAVAFKSFVRPMCEYDDIIFMGASAVCLQSWIQCKRWLRNCVR